jgi:hypothetical protein
MLTEEHNIRILLIDHDEKCISNLISQNEHSKNNRFFSQVKFENNASSSKKNIKIQLAYLTVKHYSAKQRPEWYAHNLILIISFSLTERREFFNLSETIIDSNKIIAGSMIIIVGIVETYTQERSVSMDEAKEFFDLHSAIYIELNPSDHFFLDQIFSLANEIAFAKLSTL